MKSVFVSGLFYFNAMTKLSELKEKIFAGGCVTPEEIDGLLTNGYDRDELLGLAEEITRKFAPRHFDRCSIINAKSGLCSEDCKWCAQSVHHKTGVNIYPLVDKETCLEHARFNAEQNVERFSIVTSGRKPNKKQIQSIAESAEYIRENCNIKLCASLGLLAKEDLETIYNAGIERYHCNLESAPSFFGHLCTSHTTEEKIKTLKAAREVGMDICSGGIIGMGETMRHRVELAFVLRDLGVKSIPLNILQPIKGTPLQDMPALPVEEILETIALFRIINPDAYLRFAGGRASLSDADTRRAMRVGINSAIMGDMLTTTGAKIKRDMEIIKEEGYEL